MADIPGAVGGAPGLTNKGELIKLVVQSFDNVERKGTMKKFEAFINPDEYSLSYNVATDKTAVTGKNVNTQDVFLHIQPIEISLKFFLDGTNITGQALDVKKRIGEFHEVIGYDGKVHKPRYLRIIWGNAVWIRTGQDSFDCFLKSATIQYKMFKPDGTPLRAVITATFTEVLSQPIGDGVNKESSPDLTHIRIVKEGDTLPSMVKDIYGDFSYYLEVARVNNLQDFRNLLPGQKLYFPPFDKNVKKANNA
jgi:hypothetical protein